MHSMSWIFQQTKFLELSDKEYWVFWLETPHFWSYHILKGIFTVLVWILLWIQMHKTKFTVHNLWGFCGIKEQHKTHNWNTQTHTLLVRPFTFNLSLDTEQLSKYSPLSAANGCASLAEKVFTPAVISVTWWHHCYQRGYCKAKQTSFTFSWANFCYDQTFVMQPWDISTWCNIWLRTRITQITLKNLRIISYIVLCIIMFIFMFWYVCF